MEGSVYMTDIRIDLRNPSGTAVGWLASALGVVYRADRAAPCPRAEE